MMAVLSSGFGLCYSIYLFIYFSLVVSNIALLEISVSVRYLGH